MEITLYRRGSRAAQAAHVPLISKILFEFNREIYKIGKRL
jgi:hypothetical protein